ncbi:hypothetical protein [Bordetella genomosp. 2]|uniref:Uncharacterized protein n=1 Tax=Bordetella genomosp. 2 TaxID=1983456 RepID=A0A261W2S3_9BORD|nr:hypothetical protein [Bordetella genomosp. 2]OZI79883.1 hypothetical protein CAL24_08195 [Bordetella genomosp. 2]
MTTKHTPGPWQAIQHYSDGLTVVDKDGFQHVEASSIAILLDYSEKLGIGHWADSPAASREITEEEQAANARLIATAPELLEALTEAEVFMAGFEGDELQDGIDAKLQQARAAIAKANGERP